MRRRNRNAYRYIRRCRQRREYRNWIRLGYIDLVCLGIIIFQALMGVAT